MTFVKKPLLLLSLSLFIAIFVFVKNAWVAEDAYIIFRSIEQLFAGNGPVWNPHERVQAFTSPLWYVLLAFVRIFSSNVYLNAIIVSFSLWLSTVLVLKIIINNNSRLLLLILLLSASNGFFDYTSSGLENILAYFMIALYILNYLKVFGFYDKFPPSAEPVFHIKATLVLFGLLICVRHDLALLLSPSTFYVVLKNRKMFSMKQWLLFSSIVLSPIILYSVFSLIYYGFPFPNTAYAKLNTGIDKMEILNQGLKYFIISFQYDTATLVLITAAIAISFFNRADSYFRYLGYGIVLNMLYIVYIGGDFMQSRFLSYAYMISTILLVLHFAKIRPHNIRWLIFMGICSYLIFYPHTPVNSPLNHKNDKEIEGISDERGYYFSYLSLYQYVIRDKDKLFPDYRWVYQGYAFKENPVPLALMKAIGLFGYYAGTEKVIIDPLALSDPLLARLHVPNQWRIGHFLREIPDGYVVSVVTGNAVIVNPHLNEYYKKLKIITQNEALFTLERLKTIVLFNLGAYDHLLLR